MDPDISKWPLVYQILIGIGTAAAGAVAYLMKQKPGPNLNEITTDNIKALRADFETVMGAMRKSMEDRFDRLHESMEDMDRRLHVVERQIAVFEDRQNRPRV